MDRKITLTNLKSTTGNRILNFTQFVISIAGTTTITSLTGTGGIVIPTLSIILSLVIGAVQPDYNPVKQTISQLVYYPQGWLQATDFLILGIWLVLLALKCYANFAHKTTTKIAALLFAALAVGFFIIAICPTNIPGKELTTRGLIHEKTAQMICGLFPVICWLMIPEFKANRNWKKLTTYTVVTAFIGLAFGITGAWIMIKNAPYLGIIERLIFLNAVIWLVVIGINIILQKPGKGNGAIKMNHLMRTAHQTTR
jgi:Protein of unknown function (DUF998)